MSSKNATLPRLVSAADPRKKPKAGANLPIKGDSRRGVHLRSHGAYSIVRHYYAGLLDRRSAIGRFSSELGDEYARHCAFENLQDCPVTLRTKIQLAVGNMLFLAMFEPGPGSKTAGGEIRGAENTLNRILSELGLERKAKPVQTLHEWMIQQEKEKAAKAQEKEKAAKLAEQGGDQ